MINKVKWFTFLLLVSIATYKGVSAEIQRHTLEDEMDQEINNLTKVTQCRHVGSIRPFGGHKGIEGAKACDKAYKAKKFLVGDHLRVKTGDNIGCVGLNVEWIFDIESMKSAYLLNKVKCSNLVIDSITELQDNLERTYGQANISKNDS